MKLDGSDFALLQHPLKFIYLFYMGYQHCFHRRRQRASNVPRLQFDPNVMSAFLQFRGALERPMNMALGITMRWFSKARFIEPCLTMKFI